MERQMKKDKDKLRQNLIEVFQQYRDNKQIARDIKKGMKEYKVLPGQVQTYINNAEEEILNVEISKLFLLSKVAYEILERESIDPLHYFTDREAKEVLTNFEGYSSGNVSFPYKFEAVTKVYEDDYLTTIKASEITLLFENQLLQYNPETQREMRVKFDRETDQVIETPKIHENSVKEMEALYEKDELIPSMITFNARLHSGDEGYELDYDEFNKTLTVKKGSLLDVLDGFHRINAIVRSYRRRPEIDKVFKLNILNYNKGKARRYFAQLNTTNPVGIGHVKKMADKTSGVAIAEYLKDNSEFKNGGIFPSDSLPPSSNALVTMNTLIDAIDDVYKLDGNRAEEIKTSRYLAQFFNELFVSFPDEFLGDVAEHRKNSLLPANSFFFGYLVLAKKMQDENIDLKNLYSIISKIDFSRKNKNWQKLDILDEEGRISKRVKNKIQKYFSELDLKESVGIE